MGVIFIKLGYCGRMISGSKSGYMSRYPDHLVVFNANIIVDGQKAWFGDLDITSDYLTLKEIAVENEKTLYVLLEMDGRFDNEEKPKVGNFVIKFNPDGTHQLGERFKEYYSTDSILRIID